MGDIVGASNLIGITTLEQVRKSMAMEDVPDVDNGKRSVPYCMCLYGHAKLLVV